MFKIALVFNFKLTTRQKPMNKTIKTVVILSVIFFGVLFFTKSSQAADYYVKAASGGAGNGSSWTDAWVGLGAINWSTLNNGTNTLYIDGGSSGQSYGNFTVEHTGSGVLTIRPGSASPSPSGHAGKVTLGAISMGSNDYLRNFVISGENTVGGGQINMKVTSLHAMATAPQSSLTQVNTKILYLEITTGGGTNCSNSCIDLTNDTRGWEIGYNYIHDCSGGGIYANNYTSHSNTAFGDNSIHHNTIKYTNNDGALEAYYGGWDIYNNELAGWTNWSGHGDCHGDAVSAQLTKTRIFNNSFHDFTQEVFISMFGAPIDGLYIYNNVFYWTHGSWTEPGILMRNTNGRTTLNNFRVVNNVFNMNGDVGNIVFSMSAGEDYGLTITNSIIANNIFLPTTADNFYFGEGGSQTHSYSNTDLRFYRNVYEESDVKSAWHQTFYGSISSWNTVTGASGNNANKQCVTSMTSKSGYDYHLTSSDTCAKDQGLDLAATYGWTDMGVGWGKDKDGKTRPSGAWDIGPYEYGTATPDTTPPAAPSGLSIN